MSFLNRARALIAASHGNPASAVIAAVAEKYLNAYNNLVNWDMHYNGELRALRFLVNEVDGDVFDVGANAGQWATAMLPYLSDKSLHCFEPVPAVFSKLNTSLSAAPNAKINNIGLGREPAELEMNYSPSVNTITSRYDLVFDRDDQHKITCHISTGDAYILERHIQAISILKIDVEGMEMDVLAGFDRAFCEGKVASVQFEHGEAHILSGHMLKDFVDFFESHGFAVYVVFPRALKPLHYTFSSEGFEGRNFFAIRKDVASRIGLAI